MNVGAPGARPQNIAELRTHLQQRVQQAPQQVHKAEAKSKTVGGFIKEKATYFSQKSLVDMDSRIASIDQKMKGLSDKGVDNMQPKALKSKWSVFGKVVGDMFKRLPANLLGVLKSAVKLGTYLAEAATHALVLPFSSAAARGTGDISTLTDTHKGVHSFFSKMREGLDKAQNKFDKWYNEKVGVGDGDTAKTGADKMIGTMDVVSGYMGTNILKTRGDLSETQDPRSITTGGDGDKALQIGLVTNTAAVMGDLENIGGKLDDVQKGKDLQTKATQTGNQTEKSFLTEQGQLIESQAKWGLADASRSLVSNLNGTTNLFVGSNTPVVSNVAATNVTQAMGGGLSAVSNGIEATVETIQAVQADRKIDRCNNFLKATAEIEGNQEVSASKGTSKVRDAVKLYKKNQTQTRNTSIFSAVAKYAMTAAAIAGVALFVAACASNPIGWAVGGAAIALGVGMAAYKGYKAARRADQTQGLQDRYQQVNTALNSKVTALAQKLGVDPAGFSQDGKIQAGRAIEQLTQEIRAKELRAQVIEVDDPELPQLQQDLETAKELLSLRREISSALKQTDGGRAMDTLVKALNNPRDPDGQITAEIALREVFKMDPELFKNGPDGKRLVSDEVAKMASDKLAEKLGMFHASVYSNN